MQNKNGYKVISTVMLLYGVWLLFPFFLGGYAIYSPVLYYPRLLFSSGTILKIVSLCVGIVYLFLSVIILRNEHWGRAISKYFSAIIGLLAICLFSDGVFNYFRGCELAGSISKVISIPFLPALIILWTLDIVRRKQNNKITRP